MFCIAEGGHESEKTWKLWGGIIIGQVDLHYTTEADVVVFVKNFLRDIANAMGIPLFMASDFGIKQLAPDICVFSLGLVGGGDQEASREPTILGELFDQMILVEGFYLSGPVVGILTALEDWLFCWFPADTTHFRSKLDPYTATSNESSKRYPFQKQLLVARS